MLQLLQQRADYIAACNNAKQQSLLAENANCAFYVAYIVRNDRFAVSNWYDEATVVYAINGTIETYY